MKLSGCGKFLRKTTIVWPFRMFLISFFLKSFQMNFLKIFLLLYNYLVWLTVQAFDPSFRKTSQYYILKDFFQFVHFTRHLFTLKLTHCIQFVLNAALKKYFKLPVIKQDQSYRIYLKIFEHFMLMMMILVKIATTATLRIFRETFAFKKEESCEN